ASAGRGVVLQQARARLPRRATARTELPWHHQSRQVQHRHHRWTHRPRTATREAGGRHRQPLRHAHLSGAVRAEAEGHRGHDVCRNRWRPRGRPLTRHNRRVRRTLALLLVTLVSCSSSGAKRAPPASSSAAVPTTETTTTASATTTTAAPKFIWPAVDQSGPGVFVSPNG